MRQRDPRGVRGLIDKFPCGRGSEGLLRLISSRDTCPTYLTEFTMTASHLHSLLRFNAQFPPIYLRDANDRIKVLARNGDHLATVCPPGMVCEDAVLLFRDAAQSEFHGCYGTIAALLSAYQQTGGDMNAVDETDDLTAAWADV